MAKKAYSGVAVAMAVQMPGTAIPGKTTMRMGTAVYQGQTAVGLSLRHTTKDGDWSFTGGVGTSSNGTAATVGAEWSF